MKIQTKFWRHLVKVYGQRQTFGVNALKENLFRRIKVSNKNNNYALVVIHQNKQK